MPRLTISLSPERHRALKEASARQGKTIGQIIEESLDLAGIKTTSRALEILAKARAHSGLSEADAMRIAVAETRAHRRGK